MNSNQYEKYPMLMTGRRLTSTSAAWGVDHSQFSFPQVGLGEPLTSQQAADRPKSFRPLATGGSHRFEQRLVRVGVAMHRSDDRRPWPSKIAQDRQLSRDSCPEERPSAPVLSLVGLDTGGVGRNGCFLIRVIDDRNRPAMRNAVLGSALEDRTTIQRLGSHDVTDLRILWHYRIAAAHRVGFVTVAIRLHSYDVIDLDLRS